MERLKIFPTLLACVVVLCLSPSVSRAENSNTTFGKSYNSGVLQENFLAQNKKAANLNPPTSSNTDSNLNFEAPQLTQKTDQNVTLGPVNNLNFGGAIDMRFYFPRMGGPTDEHIGFANFDIHVAELFLTTNVGENISVLAEHLLVTSKMGDTVGQDHGFVYAIFSNLPGLPDNWSLKVGRTRFRFGIDAKLDAAANILKTPVYKNLGIITDKGIELSGFSGDFEWSFGIMNGVDMVMAPVETHDGEEAFVEREIRNGSKPIVARVTAEITDSLALGVSGFTGKTYPVYSHYGFAMHDMIFNGHTDDERLIYKNRGALELKYKINSRWDFAAEYGFGNDRDNGNNYQLWSVFGRVDYKIIPSKLIAQFQYEFFDDGRVLVITEGQPYTESGNFGLGLTWFTSDQSWIRFAWLQDDRGLFRSLGDDPKSPEYMGMIQTMVTF